MQQKLVDKQISKSISSCFRERTNIFFLAMLALIMVSAAFAGIAPITFAIITVCVFGAPHNWFEFRYFLSKLPSRLATLKPFFLTAFSGTLALFALELMLLYLSKIEVVPHKERMILWTMWNQLVLGWLVALAILRYRFGIQEARARLWSASAPLAMATVANLVAPPVFTYALTYLHPMLSLWIFERELRRSNKYLLPTYHKGLLLIPVALFVLGAALWHQPADSSYAARLDSFVDTTSSTKVANPIPVNLLLAIFAFLQMLHYGVWCFGIPILSEGWSKWRLNRIAMLRDKPQLRGSFFGLSLAAAVLVIAFWLGFATKYEITNEVYVTLGTLHVLAEVPFMLWMLES